MTDIEYASTTGGASKDFEKIIINHTLKSASVSGSNTFLALYLTNPTDYNTGTEITEKWGNYSRVGISGSFSVNMTTGSASNNKDISFPKATGSWGNAKFWGITNGSGFGHSGSLLLWGPIGGFAYTIPERGPIPPGYEAGQTRNITLGRYIGPDETFLFSASNLQITLDGAYTPTLSGSILKHYLNNVRLSGSSIPNWLGLYTLVSAGSSGTSASSELAGNIGYQRMFISASGWAAPTGITTACNISYNIQDIIFNYQIPQPWYVDGAFITTSASGGQVLYQIPFTTLQTVETGYGFGFSASYLKVQVD